MGIFTFEKETLEKWSSARLSGKVTHVIGLLIESIGPDAHIGELCYIYNKAGDCIPCEVVGFKENKVLLMAMGEVQKIATGSEVYPTGEVHQIPVGEDLCGRVIDAMGRPLDGKGPIKPSSFYPVFAPPPDAMKRNRISNIMTTGVKAIDGTTTFAVGQRVGIFAGSGVGKSTLMGMIAKGSSADINVIGLIGERGREVREFIEKDLGKEGLARSVVVVVTSDQPALLRSKGAYALTAIAEYFRDQGKDVVLMMDSVTRFAMALREIGLAVGEPPTTKGYTPSVFATLPKLLERAGNGEKGSITGIYTILVEGDDLSDPISDSIRSIVDGHVVLSRKIATGGRYPAIDVLHSLSRVMPDVVTEEHLALNQRIRELMQTYEEAEDLINIGAYIKGSNKKIDEAVAFMPLAIDFLTQDYHQVFSFEEMFKQFKKFKNPAGGKS